MSGTGYKQITINRKQYLIHRIVAELFVDNDDPANKTRVNHINENKIDNRAENIEWVTASENKLHSISSMKKPKRRFTNFSDFKRREIFRETGMTNSQGKMIFVTNIVILYTATDLILT